MKQVAENKWRVIFRPYQSDFFLSSARYPALGSAWGTGKSMVLILKAMKLSEQPNNLGVLFRREFTNLRNSTMKDFTEYTGLAINEGKKSVKLPNGSEILFMHLDEIGVVQNMNLGWFGIEQADEIPDAGPFNMLRGRLRRAVGIRQGMAILNAVSEEHWAYQLWKVNQDKDPEFQMWEANSFDNEINLPADTIKDWRKIEKTDPIMFRRFIMNEWGISDDQFAVIRSEWLSALQGKGIPDLIITPKDGDRTLISVDPSLGGDECTIKFYRNCRVIDKLSLFERDTMKIVGHAASFAGNRTKNAIIDVIGIGAGIADRLAEMGFNVQYFNSSEKAGDENRFVNRRAEAYWYVREQIQNQTIPYPSDPEIRRQLVAVRYKPEKLGSRGLIALEPKAEIKKRINRSPDDADNYVMGIYGSQFVSPDKKEDTREKWDLNRYKVHHRQYSSMAA